MGKNKKKQQNQNQQQQQQNQNQNQQQQQQQNQQQEEGAAEETHNDGADENSNSNEESQTESNNNNSNNNSNNNNNNNNKQAGGNGVIVLGVYLHCQGCVETVVKSLRGFHGVEEIEPNTKDNRVVVKGKTADPIRVAERVRQKSGKHVELISPQPKKQQEKKQEKKPEAPKVVETVLKMHIHCEGCAKDIKHCFHKMHGVQTVNVDMEKSQVMVKGAFDPKDLVAYISKRAGRHAEIVNPKNQKNKKNEGEGGNDDNENGNGNSKKEKGNNDQGKNIGLAYPQVPPGLVYAPQLFSDENPNACSIM